MPQGARHRSISRYFCIGLTAALLLIGGPRPASAFSYNGGLIDPSITANPIEVILWIMPGPTQTQQDNATEAVLSALQRWEGVPTSRIAFDISFDYGQERPEYEPHQMLVPIGLLCDPINPVEPCVTHSTAEGPIDGNPGHWGGALAHMAPESIERAAIHELGHALGLAHSSITSNRSDLWAQSDLPHMHYAGTTFPNDLRPDDIAGISSAYPNPSLSLLDVGGTVTGRLLVGGSQETILGINVVAVESNTGVPHVARISGDMYDDGVFELPGLAPGTYDILFLDAHSFEGKLVGQIFEPEFSMQTDNFVEFRIDSVTVEVSEITDLGNVGVEIAPMSFDYISSRSWNPAMAMGIDDYLPNATANQEYSILGGDALLLHIAGGLRELTLTEVAGIPMGLGAEMYVMGWYHPDLTHDGIGIYGMHFLRLSGVPLQPGYYTLDFRMRDRAGQTGWMAHNLIVEPVPASQGAITYFPFDGDTRDHSGNDNHGTFDGGTPSFVQDQYGHPGGAIEFDGIDDFINVANESVFDIATYTIVAVVKVPDFERDNHILSKGRNFGNFALMVLDDVGPNPGKGVYVHQTPRGNYSYGTPVAVPRDTYFCIAAAVDRSRSTITTFFNGVSIGTSTNMGAHRFTDEPLTLGFAEFSTGKHYFRGAMDELVIVHDLLPAPVIQDLCGGWFSEYY